MNSHQNNPDFSTALGRLLGWFDTITTDAGYTGPVVSFRANALRFTGPGNDWRREGILEGCRVLFEKTQDPRWLEIIKDNITQFLNAQRLDGRFENSYFEWNPFEGGMPHEPAVLAAACRALRVLKEQGQEIPALETTIHRYLDEVLTTRLWNKSMRFVRDWEISDFQWSSSASCAASLDLIIEWWKLGHTYDFDMYVEGLTNYLNGLQACSGAAAGGIPSSNRRGAGISPFLAARCLRPLRSCAQFTNSSREDQAADQLAHFLQNTALPEGGFQRLLWSWRPASRNPLLTGATASILSALLEDNRCDAAMLEKQEAWLLDLQTPSGAFRHALGYGHLRPRKEQSDWRDWIAAAGWQDKLFHFLALRTGNESPTLHASQPFETDTRVQGRSGQFRETPEVVEIYKQEQLVYRWQKKARMAEHCELH